MQFGCAGVDEAWHNEQKLQKYLLNIGIAYHKICHPRVESSEAHPLSVDFLFWNVTPSQPWHSCIFLCMGVSSLLYINVMFHLSLCTWSWTFLYLRKPHYHLVHGTKRMLPPLVTELSFSCYLNVFWWAYVITSMVITRMYLHNLMCPNWPDLRTSRSHSLRLNMRRCCHKLPACAHNILWLVD